MVNIEILRDYTCTDTIVPNEFIDFFMPEANGEFVKVYLYLCSALLAEDWFTSFRRGKW